ncbi:U32 family peptidase [candidate division KSB1 bacterium]|nr:U32 family peptidase [candidate division KSB1 bacterium]
MNHKHPHKKFHPELLSPVGDYEMLRAAIQGGADAVYFGIEGLNMRARARNFDLAELPRLIETCHHSQVKAYLTLNTVIFEDELDEVKSILIQAKKHQVDAIICWDFAVINLARQIGLPIHLSTQASAANSEAIQLYQQLGVTRFVLARECSLDQIQTLKSKTSAELEVFIHGAMCVSQSGRCFISQFLFNKSANRGECLQPCRRKYQVTDLDTGFELALDNHHVMSPKDLCTIDIIDKLIETGIDAFKIEGRARSPEYVKIVTSCYREAIDLYADQQLTPEAKDSLKQKLRTVFNRDFSTGFYLGKPLNEWTDSEGSKATTRREFIGIVSNYYKNPEVADILIQSSRLAPGDQIMIIGPTTGVAEIVIESMEIEGKPVTVAQKGQHVGIKTGSLVRRNDKVYKLIGDEISPA